MRFHGKKLRHEFKYYLHLHEYLTQRQRVSSLLQMDEHSKSDEGYEISSLYFDGPHDHALYDKVNGIFQREKYRIRIYNGTDETINLERKSRYGEYVSKDSARLTREEYERILVRDVSVISNTGVSLLDDFYHAVAYRAFRPVVIVTYTREAYVYGPGDVRITFDKLLSAVVNTYDLFDPQLVKVEALETPLTIMEVKYNEFLPEPVRILLRPDAHQRSTISKYVICREVSIRNHKP